MSDYLYQGVDLSQWNGTVDFKKLKNAGYSFVLLRAGYGRESYQKDNKFEEYYSKAKEAGVHIGCYWFSYANTAEDAEKEAKAFLTVVNGKKFDFPCYYDVEDNNTCFRANKATLTRMVNTWCSIVEKAGYKAGLYTFYSAINRFNMDEISYDKWLAKWSNNMGGLSTSEWQMWQHGIIGHSNESTISGQIPGCEQSSGVDVNYCYKDYLKDKTTNTTPTNNNTSTDIKKYSKTCWTGDSRTVQMNMTTGVEIYASKGGETINYFNKHYSEISNKSGYNIFCWYGVNGATIQGAKDTAAAYNKLASDLKGKSQIYVGTIGPCINGNGSGKVDGGAGQSIAWQNNAITSFNTELLKNLSSDIKVIDTYAYINILASQLGASAITSDNLHYKPEISRKIKQYVDSQINNKTSNTTLKSTSEIVKEVLEGKWGNGKDRKNALTAAGYDYNIIQSAVNSELSKNYKQLKSTSEIVKEVLEGKWGNGVDRKNALTAAGYDYNVIQSAVNATMSNSSSKNNIITTGSKVILNNVDLFAAASNNKAVRTISGTYFIYSSERINGKIRITNSSANVGKTPQGLYVTGWIKYTDIK